MIDPPFIRSAKTLRTPFGYQNKPETTRFSDMAENIKSRSCMALIRLYDAPFSHLSAS